MTLRSKTKLNEAAVAACRMSSRSSQAYWLREGLGFYFDKELARTGRRADPAKPPPLKPQIGDLVRLHQLIRQRKCQTVLEFGVGCSTAVIADALAKNEAEYRDAPNRPKLRNSNAFRLFSVDTSRHWIDVARARLPNALRPRVDFTYSPVVAGTFNGRLCHYYTRLPNVVADFIYLDGPAAADVTGEVNGLSFAVNERTVIAADILLMESTLLPGTFILVDGRANNARFLQRNFQRPFSCRYDAEADVTMFELTEPPLGKREGAQSEWGRSFHAS